MPNPSVGIFASVLSMYEVARVVTVRTEGFRNRKKGLLKAEVWTILAAREYMVEGWVLHARLAEFHQDAYARGFLFF